MQVQRLNWFSGGRLTFVSLHDPRVADRFPDLSLEQLMKQMYVISPGGDQYAGAAAVRYLSRRLPRLWLAAPFLHIPFSLPLWQAAYDWVARNRYRIAGRNSACDSGTCQTHFDR